MNKNCEQQQHRNRKFGIKCMKQVEIYYSHSFENSKLFVAVQEKKNFSPIQIKLRIGAKFNGNKIIYKN